MPGQTTPKPEQPLAKSKGGRPRLENPKVPVTLRIDPDIIAAFKADGDGWQTRMHEALRLAAAAMKRRRRT